MKGKNTQIIVCIQMKKNNLFNFFKKKSDISMPMFSTFNQAKHKDIPHQRQTTRWNHQ